MPSRRIGLVANQVRTLDLGAAYGSVEVELIGTPGEVVFTIDGTTPELGAAMATPAAPTVTANATGGTIAAATTVSYRITALDADGGETAASPAGTATTGLDTTNSATITWAAVPGATGYKIYGRTSGTEALIATVGAVTTYTDTGETAPSGALPSAGTASTGGRNAFILPGVLGAKETVSRMLNTPARGPNSNTIIKLVSPVAAVVQVSF